MNISASRPAKGEAAALSLPSGAFTYRFLLAGFLLILIVFSLALDAGRVGICILTLVLCAGSADVLFRCGAKDLLNGRFSFALLVSVCLSCALLYSLVYTFFSKPLYGPLPGLYAEIGFLTALALWAQRRAVKQKELTKVFIKKLDDFLPKSGRLLVERRQAKVFAQELKPGDVILVKPGERIPCEGEIVKGKSAVDESLITGNMLPATKAVGSRVFSGTLNKSDDLYIKVTDNLASSPLMGVVNAIKTSELQRGERESKLDKFSAGLLPFALLCAGGAYAYLLYSADYARAAYFGGALLLAAGLGCPAAFIFSQVFSEFFARKGAAARKIELQNMPALEVLDDADTLFFDKTGTLTYGELRISGVYPQSPAQKKVLLECLATSEQLVDGPFAAAVNIYAQEHGIKTRKLLCFDVLPGLGVTATLARSKDKIIAGRAQWFAEQGLKVQGLLFADGTTICVAKNGEFLGYVTLSDVLRPGAHDMVQYLKEQKKEVILMSGDNESSVLTMAKGAGIDQMNFNVMPQTKAEIVGNMRALGKQVVMVGDGFNDITALLKANAGIVFSSGNNVYNNWVDIIIHRSDLYSINDLFTINKKLKNNLRANIFLAVLCNAAMLAWLLFFVNGPLPWFTALLCQLGGVLAVFLNAARLLNVK